MSKHPLASRKLWAAIASALGVVATALAGNLEWAAAIQNIVTIALGYIGIVGLQDIAGIVAAVFAKKS
jgi:hypothetical protein